MILSGIRNVFGFDPNKSVYNPAYGKQQYDKRKQRASKEGTSVYELYDKQYRNCNKEVKTI